VRVLLLLAAFAAVLVLPASARAACPTKTVLQAEQRLKGRTVTSAVDCRSGRPVVLAAGAMRARGGTRIADVSAAGARVAIAVGHRRGRRSTAEIVVLRLRDGSVVSRRRILRTRRQVSLVHLQVAMTSFGDLAWLVPIPGEEFETKAFVRPVGGRTRFVVREYPGELEVDDDGTFVIGAAPPRFVELRPPPFADGCPRRERFRVAASTPEMTVTVGDVGSDVDFSSTIVRACLRGTRRESTVGSFESSTTSGGDDVDAVTARGTVALMSLARYGKGAECEQRSLVAVDVVARRRRKVEVPYCATVSFADMTTTASPIVLATQGAVARLLATTPDGAPLELDRGTITDVAVDGTRVTWRRDGEPRSGDVP
jgi:hypothetical protein